MDENRDHVWRAGFRLAAVLFFVSGLIHLVIIPHHWAHAPAHGLAMGVIGVVQLIWAVVFWFKPGARLAQAGLALAVIFITLWAITRVLPAPFTNEAEEVDATGIITKLLEGGTALLLIAGLRRSSVRARQAQVWQGLIVPLLLLGVFLGVGIYEAGRLSQPLFPSLMGVEDHEHMEPGAHDQGFLPEGSETVRYDRGVSSVIASP